LALAALFTLLLLIFAHSAFGKTVWLRRLGWVSPREGFWLYSFAAGVAAALGVWSIARMFHQSLGAVPDPYKVLLASSSGAMLEELLFRGLLFWLLFQLVSQVRAFQRHACAVTVLVIAIGFALSHVGRTGLSLFTTVLTGAAYGWMRVRSESTAAAALMHGVYNFVLSWIATL
jgi:membrane protease YdiL (CAAX protease family)